MAQPPTLRSPQRVFSIGSPTFHSILTHVDPNFFLPPNAETLSRESLIRARSYTWEFLILSTVSRRWHQEITSMRYAQNWSRIVILLDKPWSVKNASNYFKMAHHFANGRPLDVYIIKSKLHISGPATKAPSEDPMEPTNTHAVFAALRPFLPLIRTLCVEVTQSSSLPPSTILLNPSNYTLEHLCVGQLADSPRSVDHRNWDQMLPRSRARAQPMRLKTLIICGKLLLQTLQNQGLENTLIYLRNVCELFIWDIKQCTEGYSTKNILSLLKLFAKLPSLSALGLFFTNFDLLRGVNPGGRGPLRAISKPNLIFHGVKARTVNCFFSNVISSPPAIHIVNVEMDQAITTLPHTSKLHLHDTMADQDGRAILETLGTWSQNDYIRALSRYCVQELAEPEPFSKAQRSILEKKHRYIAFRQY